MGRLQQNCAKWGQKYERSRSVVAVKRTSVVKLLARTAIGGNPARKGKRICGRRNTRAQRMRYNRQKALQENDGGGIYQSIEETESRPRVE